MEQEKSLMTDWGLRKKRSNYLTINKYNSSTTGRWGGKFPTKENENGFNESIEEPKHP